MKFLWILLFGNVIRITDVPLRLDSGPYEILLRKPISAVTADASIEVEVSAMIPREELTLAQSKKWVEKNIQAGCLKADLRRPIGPSIRLDFHGRSSFAPGKVYLILFNPTGTPVGEQFHSVELTACKPLNNVVVYWRNYKL